MLLVTKDERMATGSMLELIPFVHSNSIILQTIATLEMRRKVDVMYDDIIDGRGGVVLFIFYGRIKSLMECVRVFAVFK